MNRTLVLLILLLTGCSKPGALRRAKNDDTSGDDGHQQPSNCVQRASVSITASPMDLTFPTPTTVSWFASIPEDCPSLNTQLQVGLNGIQVGNQVVEPVGTRTFMPAGTTIYGVLVGDTSGSSSATKGASVTVTVSGVPNPLLIDGNTVDPVSVLIGALTESPNENQIVELCGDNLKLDFSSWRRIHVPSGRTLRAAPGCERSLRRLGPVIFSHFKGGGPLFVIDGDHVTFSGFRLEGPESGLGTDENGGAKGLYIEPPGCPRDQDGNPADCKLPALQHVEISNMEIYQWDSAGVEVTDTHAPSSGLGRLWNTNVGAVHITNNFIHDNRHTHVGYGVVVGNGAYALIEKNVFNQNRHAIAGGSHDDTERDFSGYTARDNLILPGGGLHCAWYGCWHTHLVDMHGDEKHWYTGDNQCGRAGETMIIERNTILYTAGEAIRIRGNPMDKVVVDRNVLSLKADDDWIGQAGSCSFWGSGDNITKPIDVRPTNVLGEDPMSQLADCRFAGDEVADQFMASGVTWWVRSGLTGQWRYLNTMPEKVSQLQFRDFDGDGICDVLPRTRFSDTVPEKYSKGGITPWIPVTVISPTP
jgi:hypothetical protein